MPRITPAADTEQLAWASSRSWPTASRNVVALNHSRNTPAVVAVLARRDLEGAVDRRAGGSPRPACLPPSTGEPGRSTIRSCALCNLGRAGHRPIPRHPRSRRVELASAPSARSRRPRLPTPSRSRPPRRYDPAPTTPVADAAGDDRRGRAVEPEDLRRRGGRDRRADDHRPGHRDPRLRHRSARSASPSPSASPCWRWPTRSATSRAATSTRRSRWRSSSAARSRSSRPCYYWVAQVVGALLGGLIIFIVSRRRRPRQHRHLRRQRLGRRHRQPVRARLGDRRRDLLHRRC